jgi:hypothetical protein
MNIILGWKHGELSYNSFSATYESTSKFVASKSKCR